MSTQSFHWRTVLEVGLISAVLYILIGAPGLPFRIFHDGQSTRSAEIDVPVARASTESLVYPDKGLKCSSYNVGIHLFSTSPLIIYINDFLSESETKHLIDIR